MPQLEALCSAPEELAKKAQVIIRIRASSDMLWCNTGRRLTTSSQLCAEALDSLGQGGKAAGAPSVKIPASSPMDIPGSPLSPLVLKPVAAIATLFNSREQRIQQQKERRERRKEMMKMGKSAKADAASKGNADETNARHVMVMMVQANLKTTRKTAMKMHPRHCHGAAARTPPWRVTCDWP